MGGLRKQGGERGSAAMPRGGVRGRRPGGVRSGVQPGEGAASEEGRGDRRPWAEGGGGGGGRDKVTVANGNHAPRDRGAGTGSPVMRPKTLPGSKSHTGKTPRSL